MFWSEIIRQCWYVVCTCPEIRSEFTSPPGLRVFLISLKKSNFLTSSWESSILIFLVNLRNSQICTKKCHFLHFSDWKLRLNSAQSSEKSFLQTVSVLLLISDQFNILENRYAVRLTFHLIFTHFLKIWLCFAQIFVRYCI